MVDTARTLAEIYALLADNNAGDISPQDLRDAIETLRPKHGEIHVPAANAAAVSITDTTNYFEVTAPTWVDDSEYSFDQSAGNGRLTYIGVPTIMVHVALSISFTAANNNQTIHIRVGKNTSTLVASEAQRRVSTGTDVGSTAVHVITSLSTGDYVSVWLRNDTSTSNPTIQVCNLQLMTMPM